MGLKHIFNTTVRTRESHFLQDRQESVESSRIQGQKTKQHDLPGVINVFAGTLHHGGGFTFPMRVVFYFIWEMVVHVSGDKETQPWFHVISRRRFPFGEGQSWYGDAFPLVAR